MSSARVIDGIQFLRGAAALFVVVAHCNGLMGYPEYFGSSPFNIENLGGFGVAIFFVISGFIIAIVSLTPNGEAKLSVPDFAGRRFRRIVPFLWLCIIGYNLFTLVGTGTVEWGPAVRALFLWPIGDLKPNVTWTLRHEMLFYALFALTLLTAKRRPWLLALWCAAPLVVSSAAVAFPEAFANLHPWLQDLVNVLLVGRGANLQFGVGVVLGLLWLQQQNALRPLLPGGPAIPLILAMVGGAIYQTLTPVLMFNPVHVVPVALTGPVEILLMTVLATIIVWSGAVVKQSVGPAAWLAHLLGDASFSIYLTHSAALLALLEISRRVPIELPLPLVLAGFTVLATLVGVGIHFAVERPLLRLLTRPATRSAAQAAEQ